MRPHTATKTLALFLLLALTQACSTQASKPEAPAAEAAPATPSAPAAPQAETPKQKCAMHGAMGAGGHCAEGQGQGQSQGCCEHMKEGEKCPHHSKPAKKSKKSGDSKK